MRSGEAVLRWTLLLGLGCGGGGGGPGGGDSPNAMALTVNGSLCSPGSYVNKPCVSLTLCTPGGSQCQTIGDILLDTGSYGVRLFKQVVTVPLGPPPAQGALAECVQFGDGSSDWGPVETAGVGLGGEPVVQVPIQIIDATFAAPPSGCAGADANPAAARFNGILGVGPFAEDCGAGCEQRPDVGIYFQCSGSSCTGTTVPVSQQVQNPVALLPQDNNGVVVQLPAVGSAGSPSVDGSLVLGIGTRSSNSPSGATAYALDDVGELETSLGGNRYRAFLDTGSNGLFFPPPASPPLASCPSPDVDWFCPAAATALSATNSGATGSPSVVVGFQIGNFEQLVSTPNNAFANIGGSEPPGQGFDWGLPFHFGRSVYVGIEGRSSGLGTGPYVAF